MDMTDVILKKLPDYYLSRVMNVSDNDSLPHLHQALEIYFLIDGHCNYIVGESAAYDHRCQQ